MYNVIQKLISKETLEQNFISFYVYNLKICPKTQELFLKVLGKNNLRTPSTSNKCNSLIKVQMMLKFRENVFFQIFREYFFQLCILKLIEV
jgi:hypothetical protein